MTEDLFPGAARALPEPADGVFRLVEDIPPAVRHAAGYAPFADAITAHGESPARLADDMPALLSFLAAQQHLLDDPTLITAAAVFFGNALIVSHPRASWEARQELEVGTRSRSFPVVGAVRMLAEHPERHDGFLDLLRTWDLDDEDQDELHHLDTADRKEEVALDLPVERFARPALLEQVFLDDAGRPIPYGDPDRWNGSPPESAYERFEHQERFDPLQTEVHALVAYLARTCRVDVEQHHDSDGRQVITLTPERGAPVRMTLSAGIVHLTAGLLFEGFYPSCSCEACNETATTAADDLENTLLGIIGGGLHERYPVGHRDWTQTTLHTPNGSRGSAGPLDPDHDNRRDRAHIRLTLASLHNRPWPAWPNHTHPSTTNRTTQPPAE